MSSKISARIDVSKIKLPDGFNIEVYANNIETARQMDFGKNVLFCGSKNGNIYAIDSNRKVYIIDKELFLPVGVDFYKGDLYVSAVSKILKYEDILNNLNSPPKPAVVEDSFPKEKHHGWKFIKTGPDGLLYVPVGAPCNVCESEDSRFASIMRMNHDGSNLEIYAQGVRNTVGFDWNPQTDVLWFTDNGRDWMGDYKPPDELNKASEKGLHFGFPYLHGKNVQVPVYWDKRPDKKFIEPVLNLPAHVASLGMRFYKAEMFPEYYKDGIFIAEHGSWNRSEKIGYRVSFVKIKNNQVKDYKIFASGWLQGEDYWGRPADVEIGPEGSLYVSDDYAGCIYRIYYTGEKRK
ncbi:MAG: PQQ-dependent sugar dehydrogenase [Atribacterota bacterium]